MSTNKQLEIGDLEIGMKVSTNQLNNIYDTYIILGDSTIVEGNIVGTIVFIGEKIDDSISEIRSKYTHIASVYNESTESGDETYYEE